MTHHAPTARSVGQSRSACYAAVLLSLSVLLPGCATVVRGMSEPVRIESEPPGARVTARRTNAHVLDREGVEDEDFPSRASCTTPCTLEFRRRSDILIEVAHPDAGAFDYVVTDSALRSSGTGSAANVVIGAGTGVGGALLVTGFANSVYSTFGSAVISQGTIATAATGAGLGFAAAGLAIDAGSGANRNLLPNHVKVEFPEDGAIEATDPLAEPLRRFLVAEEAMRDACAARRGSRDCRETFKAARDAQKAYLALSSAREDELQRIAKDARDRQKAEQRAARDAHTG